MTIEYLKKALRTAEGDHESVRAATAALLTEIEQGGEEVVLRLAKNFDNWDGPVTVSSEDIDRACAALPEQIKLDIQFAHSNIKRFAEAQLATLGECSLELSPGFKVGQKNIPVTTAGCYVPGGRYTYIASALMTITTAKVAGVENIIACAPPQPGGRGIAAEQLYAMSLAGATHIITLGGVQGIASMAFGLFNLPEADILVGPGNQYVAEAKRLLFGRVGIDMVAGPTDSMIVADDTADAGYIAADLIGQAEHGANSPVWLVTTSSSLAKAVMSLIPNVVDALPEPNRSNAEAAWRDYAEVILVSSREEAAQIADQYAPEHLHIQAAELEWWLGRLRCYGSLFLGEETTVAYGDKAAGPNHVLPTSGAARYTGGLSVLKYIKTVTWQRATAAAACPVGETTARISRLEGLEGHARTADVRLERFAASRNSA